MGSVVPIIGTIIGAIIGGLISKFTEQGEAPTKFKLSSMPGFVASGKGIDDIQRNGNTTVGYRNGQATRVQVDTAFGSLGGGLQHVGKDGQLSDEDAAKYLADLTQVFQGLAGFDDALSSLLDGDKLGAVKDAMVAFEQDLVNKKPQDIEAFIEARYDAIFGAIGDDMEGIYLAMKSNSADAGISEIVGQVTAFFGTIEGYKNVFADYDEAVRVSQLTLFDAAAEFTDSLYEQIAAYDGSIEANATITAGLQQRYQLELQMLAQIDAAQASVSATLGKSIEQIKLSQMSDKQRYDYLTEQSEALAASLSNMTDPAQITQTVNEINRLTMEAWNGLSEAQKAQVAGGFEEYLASVDERANAQLEKAREETQQEHDALVAAYTDLAGAARELIVAVGGTPADVPTTTDTPADSGNTQADLLAGFDLSIEKQSQAADKNQAAADKLDAAITRFDQSVSAFSNWATGLPSSFNFNLVVDAPEVGA